MKITIEPTTKLVTIRVNGAEVPARIWQGHVQDGTRTGVPLHCYILRVVPEVHKLNPAIDTLLAEFERELQRCADPRAAVEAIPLRMVI